jgi:hypothetical protein
MNANARPSGIQRDLPTDPPVVALGRSYFLPGTVRGAIGDADYANVTISETAFTKANSIWKVSDAKSATSLVA